MHRRLHAPSLFSSRDCRGLLGRAALAHTRHALSLLFAAAHGERIIWFRRLLLSSASAQQHSATNNSCLASDLPPNRIRDAIPIPFSVFLLFFIPVFFSSSFYHSFLFYELAISMPTMDSRRRTEKYLGHLSTVQVGQLLDSGGWCIIAQNPADPENKRF
jgi:hypothetical protein